MFSKINPISIVLSYYLSVLLSSFSSHSYKYSLKNALFIPFTLDLSLFRLFKTKLETCNCLLVRPKYPCQNFLETLTISLVSSFLSFILLYNSHHCSPFFANSFSCYFNLNTRNIFQSSISFFSYFSYISFLFLLHSRNNNNSLELSITSCFSQILSQTLFFFSSITHANDQNNYVCNFCFVYRTHVDILSTF